MTWTLEDQRALEELARSRGYCDVCGKRPLSRNQTILFQTDTALCLECAIVGDFSLGEDDRIEMSVDLARRLRDGIQ